jgi:16S rRNA (uracil1498-N3)-methyltransferase
MSERFFSAEPITGEQVLVEGPEAHHLLHVMRAEVGQQVTLFDGSGAEFSAEVASCGRADVELRILDQHMVSRELPFSLVVGVSLPKGDRQKWLVEKLTELGVTTVVPLVTERGVAQPTAAAIERLERTVVEAAKQCGRNRLMRIATPQEWGEWVTAARMESSGEVTSDGNRAAGPVNSSDCRRLVAHPGGLPLARVSLSAMLPTCVALGPEGGFTDDEVAAAIDSCWQIVDLGPRLLRVETAAIMLAASVVAMTPAP